MLSIGMCTYSTKPRGSVVHAASLAEALSRAGHAVTLYALAKADASFFRPVSCRVQLIAAGPAPADLASLIAQRVGEFARGLDTCAGAHDVWHAQDCLAASALLAASDRTRRARARTVHHVDRFEDPYLAACQRRSILEADLVFAVSRLTQREVEAEFGRKTTVISNGVDVSRFARPAPGAADGIRAKYGIDPRDTLILSVGGIEPRKNTRRSLAAVARLYAKHPRTTWLIAGGESIWDHAAYKAGFYDDLAALPADLAARIVMPGAVSEDDLTDLYRASDVLLCPSTQEGFGLCVLESMAAGTSAVVPGREPFTEYVDEHAAALVDPESVDSITEALVGLVLDPRRRRRLAAVARGVATRFSWDNSAAAHVPHYEALRRAAKGERNVRLEECPRDA